LSRRAPLVMFRRALESRISLSILLRFGGNVIEQEGRCFPRSDRDVSVPREMQDRILPANCFVCPEMCTERNNTEAENGYQLGAVDLVDINKLNQIEGVLNPVCKR
jgi:hypothetical protein